MKLDRNAQIADHSAYAVRDALRSMKPHFTTNQFATALGVERQSALDILGAMTGEGLVKRTSRSHWAATLSGEALCSARLGQSIPRATADLRLAEFIDRVKDANASDRWLWWIDTVALFGEMLDPDATTVRDIDVVLVLPHRYDRREMDRRYLEAVNDAGRGGRFLSTDERYSWPKVEFERYLQGESGTISMITRYSDELYEKGVAVVYSRLHDASSEGG